MAAKETIEGDCYIESTLEEQREQRRCMLKDTWSFYRLMCSLLRDRRRYDEVFRRIQSDPVYPYLTTVIGMNDTDDMGSLAMKYNEKLVCQHFLPKYTYLSQREICRDLVDQANAALSQLLKVCKVFAKNLGLEQIGVGPVKDIEAAMRKAELKYGGDVLSVTDYCRALLVVKDLPALLAAIELAQGSFGPLTRRIKLSTLKSGHNSLPGGYRDCKINVELQGHICEIQIHLWPMWKVCGVDGFRHYRHCRDYNSDTFDEPFDLLKGTQPDDIADLIMVAEEELANIPIEHVKWYQEQYILDYFAEAGLHTFNEDHDLAEITLRHLVRLRTENPEYGRDHVETRLLQKYLENALRSQAKIEEAREINALLTDTDNTEQRDKLEYLEPENVTCCFMLPFECWGRKKLGKDDEQIEASMEQWMKIRDQRFHSLEKDTNQERSSQLLKSFWPLS